MTLRDASLLYESLARVMVENSATWNLSNQDQAMLFRLINESRDLLREWSDAA